MSISVILHRPTEAEAYVLPTGTGALDIRNADGEVTIFCPPAVAEKTARAFNKAMAKHNKAMAKHNEEAAA